MMGYMPSQQSMGAGFQGHASTHQHASQLSHPQQLVLGSAYGMPSPSMQLILTEIQDLRDQVARLQQQLQAMEGPSDLPGGGHARMYSAQAVVNEVHQVHGGVSDLILDGGTTHHVARFPHLLFSLRSSHINSVLVAGGESHEVVRQGDMIRQTLQGEIVIRDVLCVPSFVVNLMSESEIDECGGNVLKSRSQATVRNAQGRVTITGELRDKLYVLKCSIRRSDVADVPLVNHMRSQAKARHPALQEAELHLLHRRLGHPGMRITRELLEGNIVLGLLRGMKMNKDEPCLVCDHAKHHRASFPTSENKPTRPLAVIHSDMMGPFRVLSTGGHRYTVSLIDGYSCYGEIFPIKAKSDVSHILPEVIHRWQRQTERTVMRIRTDRGKEYEETSNVSCEGKESFTREVPHILLSKMECQKDGTGQLLKVPGQCSMNTACLLVCEVRPQYTRLRL
jgi:hypothetical protein